VKKLEFKRIGILIGFALVVSISIQVWRNYSQFQVIQNQLISDIQQSLDNAVENYYAELAKTDIITLTETRPNNSNKSIQVHTRVTRLSNTPLDSTEKSNDQLERNNGSFKSFKKSNQGDLDSIFRAEAKSHSSSQLVLMDSIHRMGLDQKKDLRIYMERPSPDSLDQLKSFTKKIIISITRDTLDFDLLNSFLYAELERKGIDIDYRLVHLREKDKADSLQASSWSQMPFKTVSRSTFLPYGQSLEMYFENTAMTILRRGFVEILTSLIFLGVIAFAFYYLYQTIKNQKEIAEIKQDLISNITHEFKTPIATTLSAIEGIEQFNPGNDPDKTKRYLGVSKSQMHKLNQMVEKLLETAALDTDQLALKKEPLEPEPLLHQLVQKFRTLAPHKKIELILPSQSKPLVVDAFHFENALSNLLDNAVKYGGEEIRLSLDQNGMNQISIWDNGGNISSEQNERVFEQFYRIPKGDLHDVKGFGIGLYYVKKILEKHEGKIELQTGKKSTTFTTYWP
jgi:signal transduction histidine kinase